MWHPSRLEHVRIGGIALRPQQILDPILMVMLCACPLLILRHCETVCVHQTLQLLCELSVERAYDACRMSRGAHATTTCVRDACGEGAAADTA
jgi:hypothetical protein